MKEFHLGASETRVTLKNVHTFIGEECQIPPHAYVNHIKCALVATKNYHVLSTILLENE